MKGDIVNFLSYYWSVPLQEWLTMMVWKGYCPNYYLSNGKGFVKDVDKQRPLKCVLIYFHGTNGNIYSSVQRLSGLQMNIYYIEYPGYSDQSRHSKLSSNTFTSQVRDIINDILLDIPEDVPLVLYCRSIGSGVLFECMDMFKYSDHNIRGIILETPFKNLHSAVSMYVTAPVANMFCYFTGWNLEVKDYITNNLEWFKKDKIRFMFITGKDDDITPYKHAQEIYDILIESNITAVFHCYELFGHNIPFEEFAPQLQEWIYTCIIN